MSEVQLKELANELAHHTAVCRTLAREYQVAALDKAQKEIELKHAMDSAGVSSFLLDDGRQVVWIPDTGDVIIEEPQEEKEDE